MAASALDLYLPVGLHPAPSSSWIQDAVFYHLYPLGCLGAPARNSFPPQPAERLHQLHAWLDMLEDLGANILLLGPLFQSSAHGYDIVDYFRVDSRLGTTETLSGLSRDLHQRGMRLVLDAVFHHTGRDFWAFQDVLRNGRSSPYCDWYHLDFSRSSPLGDPFYYEGWAGHYDLVKLNLRHWAVREHLFNAVTWWIEAFDIDGLRLDAADRLDPDFRRDLATHCKSLKPGFWLMGEVVNGDYRQWAHPGGLCSTTNYELYKSLYSAHNDRNFFELAYALDRQSGPGGLYRDLVLYAFADNHDVDRVASILHDPRHLYPLYLLLLTIPGTPSLYYGSEWGTPGRRTGSSDSALRPALTPASLRAQAPHPDLYRAIQRLLKLRRDYSPLRHGAYTQLHVDHSQIAFQRGSGAGAILVAVNSADASAQLTLRLLGVNSGSLIDRLNPGSDFPITNGQCTLPLDPCWGRVLELAC